MGHPIQNPTDKIVDTVHLPAHLELQFVRRCVEHSDFCRTGSVSVNLGTGES